MAHDEKATLSQTVPSDRRSAVILTVGDELTSGDVENTNASWLARSLEALGCGVRLVASVPDDVEAIARFLRLHRGDADCVIVTGGLGGTPDDVTREARRGCVRRRRACSTSEAAAPLRERFAGRGLTGYAERWATLPRGSEPLGNPLGGRAGVRALGGLRPARRAGRDARVLRVDQPALPGRRRSSRRVCATRSSRATSWTALVAFSARFEDVALGSYPSFDDGKREVELVLKSRDAARLAEAVAWLESAIDAR